MTVGVENEIWDNWELQWKKENLQAEFNLNLSQGGQADGMFLSVFETATWIRQLFFRNVERSFIRLENQSITKFIRIFDPHMTSQKQEQTIKTSTFPQAFSPRN